MILILKFLAIILGLTLPGYLLARALRLEHAWATAFPFSALLIGEGIVFFAIADIRISQATMTLALLAMAVLCLSFRPLRLAPVRNFGCHPSIGKVQKPYVIAICFFATATVLTVALRTTLFPLRGLDTAFRWEGLARAMLLHHSIAFYPPVSASDFSVYLYPDGIPPLVASVYWWIYAVFGRPLPQATALSVVCQLLTTMALTYYGTRHAFGSRPAWCALLATCATPLLIGSFSIGQETGFTTLSVAGQLCFAWAAVRNPKPATIVAVALFATLGALARDYGPALAIAGFSVLAWHSSTRRYLLLFLLITIAFSAPWYLRNWVVADNPFYSHRLPGGLAVNATHAAIMDYYRGIFAFGQFDRTRWLGLVKHLMTGGGVFLLITIPFAFARWRETGPLLITAGTAMLLWAYSVGQTAGGVVFSTRVLAPAALALAMAAGLGISCFFESRPGSRSPAKVATILGLVLLCTYSLVSAAIYPHPSRYFFTPSTSSPTNSIQQEMVDHLNASDLPPTKVLTDLPFIAELLKRTSRFTPVMYWSPEVDFLFNQNLSPEEIQKRLAVKGIGLIYVDKISPNNRFLAKFSFFRDRSNWKLLFQYPNEAAFFYLESPQAQSMNAVGQ